MISPEASIFSFGLDQCGSGKGAEKEGAEARN
jgi:hypothetical protein